MKKHFYLFSALLAGVFITSCSNEDFVADSTVVESGTLTPVTVTATMPQANSDTKIVFGTETDKELEVKWKTSGEQFSVLKGEGSVKPNTFIEEEQNNETNIATFSGEIYKSSDTYYAIYPKLASSAAATAKEIAVSLTNTDGELNADNIYMCANALLNGNSLNFAFEHLTSIIKITLSLKESVKVTASVPAGTTQTETTGDDDTEEEGTTPTITKVTFSAKGLRTSATADITTGKYSHAEYTEQGEITVSNDEGLEKNIYIHVLPGKITDLEIAAVDSEGNTYVATDLATELEVVAGTVHATTAMMKEGILASYISAEIIKGKKSLTVVGDLDSDVLTTLHDWGREVGSGYEGTLDLSNAHFENNTIGQDAFSNCYFASIILPDDVETIGYAAFMGCSHLTGIDIPETVKVIDGMAFTACEKITEFTLPEGLTTIGTMAFGNCKGLTAITLPENLESIGTGAFVNCSNLANVYCEGTTTIPTLVKGGDGYTNFKNVKSDFKIHIPDGYVDAYKAKGWSAYEDNFAE